MRSMLKRIFPLGIMLPALLGFISVSYQSCTRSTFEEIIQSRSYLVHKNQQQISSILFSMVVAVLFWDLVVLLVLKNSRSGRRSSPE